LTLLAAIATAFAGYPSLLAAAETGARPTACSTASAAAFFDIRVVHDVAPERTGNWAVKITDLPNGRLLMVWCSTSGTEVSKTNRLWLSFSADDGATWSEPQKFAESNAEGSVLNPCCYTHANGEVFIFYNVIGGNVYEGSYRVACQTSDDGAKRWSPRRQLPTGDADTGLLSSPIRLRDGTIVLPIYFEPSKDRWVGGVLRSSDGGRIWSRGGEMPIDAPRGAAEPTIVELGDGRLYGLLRNKTGWLYQSWSGDGGRTWTRPAQSCLPSPESCPILRRLASGGVLLVWNNNTVSGGSQQPRYPLSAAVSDDDAKTWPCRRSIATTSGARQLSNHGVFQTRLGTVLVPMNHFLGVRNGAECGPIVLARFNEAWLRSASPSELRHAPIGNQWQDP
jgi:predicted neuraminidase